MNSHIIAYKVHPNDQYQFSHQYLHNLDNPTTQELEKVLNNAQMPIPTASNESPPSVQVLKIL